MSTSKEIVEELSGVVPPTGNSLSGGEGKSGSAGQPRQFWDAFYREASNPHQDINEFLTGSKIEQVRGLPKELFNSRDPRWKVDQEHFRHRPLAYMAARGCSQKEISDKMGVHVSTVRNLFRQPWFQAMVVTLQEELCLDGVEQLLKGATTDSIFKLIELRDDDKTPKAVVAKVCDSLLDRVLGKATQRVEVNNPPSVEDAAEADRQIANLQDQLKTIVTKN